MLHSKRKGNDFINDRLSYLTVSKKQNWYEFHTKDGENPRLPSCLIISQVFAIIPVALFS